LQVADFVTIILTSLLVSINFKEIKQLAFKTFAATFSDNEDSEFDIDTHIDEAYRSLFPQLARKFVEVASAALLACVVSGQFFTPALVKAKLGFLGSTKEYVDEVADIGSIFLFMYTLSVIHRSSRIVQHSEVEAGQSPRQSLGTFVRCFTTRRHSFELLQVDNRCFSLRNHRRLLCQPAACSGTNHSQLFEE